MIEALTDSSNQLWEVVRNMPLEWTRTTFQCMPAVSRGLELRKLLRYCYYINSKTKASDTSTMENRFMSEKSYCWKIWVRCANNPSYYETINFPALTPKNMTSDSVNYAAHWFHHVQLAQLVSLLFPCLEHCDDEGDRDLPGTQGHPSLCSHVLNPQRAKLCLIHNKTQ